jgi:hypothetical protein
MSGLGYQWSVFLGGQFTAIGGIVYNTTQRGCNDSNGNLWTYDVYTFTSFQDPDGTTHSLGLCGISLTTHTMSPVRPWFLARAAQQPTTLVLESASQIPLPRLLAFATEAPLRLR